ncbi:MAG TPA: sigma-54 dependent transcriptional regulator [Thermodesulfovibrionales bacterium]|nr:sigma-54 dependent transcriptional regulator [Thermodesulfovibrionales bacterium]
MNERLLIVEDEETLCESLKRVLMRDGYEVDTVSSAEAAMGMIEEVAYDLIITDILLPGIDGIELLRRVRLKLPEQIVIIITAYASIETAVGALRAGACDYVIKPIIHEEIKRIVRNALRERSLKSENIILRKQIEERYDFKNVVGQSKEITSLIEEVKKIADSKSNVLLLGETGTGKELIARAIHYNSARQDKPFVPINCSAIPETLLESELFGFVKGAFTGATTSKRGLFEEANGGTIFLDEIGDLTQQLQAKLLRVIDDHEIRPLGGVQTRKIDIRFITATNREILREVREGVFREDLYYRIAVVTIKLPPLRNRREDVPILARYFLDKYSQDIGKQVKFIDDVALKILMGYNWPGNVRELQNIIERAVLISDSNTIFPDHLPEGLRTTNTFLSDAFDKALSIENYTKEFIRHHQSDHSEQKIAEMLGITRKALWEKRKKWGMARK